MDTSGLPSIDPSTDFEKIPPIQQKRIIAFINHFITSTVSFLNTFAQSCESRLMEFEYKVQKVEAALLILETQLSSISGLGEGVLKTNTKEETLELLPPVEPCSVDQNNEHFEEVVPHEHLGPKASEDNRFAKYFKMMQFGVPMDAIKLKMQVEGLDPSILEWFWKT